MAVPTAGRHGPPSHQGPPWWLPRLGRCCVGPRARAAGDRRALVARARRARAACSRSPASPGIGKTALLDDAGRARPRACASCARAGIESEARGAVRRRCSSCCARRSTCSTRLPAPQAAALAAALALRPGPARDRFAVGAATLSLLAALAEDRPLAVLVDDAHWLDRVGAEALLFAAPAARRPTRSPCCSRRATGEPSLLDGAELPTLRARRARPRRRRGRWRSRPRLAPGAVARLHRATGGNPLALLELAADAPTSPRSRRAGAPVPVTARVAQRLRARGSTALGAATRRALLLAAAGDGGDLARWRARRARSGSTSPTWPRPRAPASSRSTGGAVAFRHPLVALGGLRGGDAARSAATAHRALAGALPDRDADRRAWHLAAAARRAGRSRVARRSTHGRRRAPASAARTPSPRAAYERAARLAADASGRARLLRAAAEAAWLAGLAERADALLDEARRGRPPTRRCASRSTSLRGTHRGPPRPA